MLQLRLTQRSAGRNQHRVEVSLEGDGARQAFESTFDFLLLDQDEEDLRWYLEDYLQYPQDPAPAIARRVEERMAEIGTELFRAILQASDDARDLWAEVRNRLPDTRIEIVTGVSEANTIPWELLRDPRTDTPLALSARSFVRAQPTQARRPHLPKGERVKIRILLVICRPMGDEDVPFRSVASRLIKGLDQANREAYDLDVLRPPTFEQLGQVLRQAKEEDRPYHVVHFDGHGTWMETEDSGGLGNVLRGLSRATLAGPRPGKHGYLLFENPKLEENAELVDGPSLGKLLAETQVPVLVLNACRSAHAEPAAQPGATADPHSQVRAFGSLAQEVMDAGAAGVVAMRYNVYVVTAAQMVAQLYASLGRGRSLGEAMTLARKNLHENPLREVAFDPLSLEDWSVPVAYEAAEVQLFPEIKGKDGNGLQIKITEGDTSSVGGSLDSSLPPPPDVGFFGRDETILALDRAFDRDSIVLLHAYAGSGKTSTAAEFARWYALTGGIEGLVLFSSFERYLPLPRVLDRIGQAFGQSLERSGVHWLALNDAERRNVALQVLAEIPVLWVWDNVEPVAGFPAGTESAWSRQEQDELVAFLRDARRTKAKFLLTSRRDERSWLGDLPTRITIPPMPLTESLQLARALADKNGRRISEVEDWRPLLAFARGNPMTVTVVVKQALREGLKSREQIENFVVRLRSGEVDFEDEFAEGRSRSLGASLAYGLEYAFNEAERKKLALLYLFQGFVNVEVLCVMGDPEAPWCLPELQAMTQEEGIALFDRAAEVGLLILLLPGYYSIHPALPWFLKNLFQKTYSEEGFAAVRAFTEAVGEVGHVCMKEYEGGNRRVISILQAEEENLLYARRLSLVGSVWGRLIDTMQGLGTLYDHAGRWSEWGRLVEEIFPHFIDAETGLPLPEREENWDIVTGYRVRLLREERRYREAEQLQDLLVSRERRRISSLLDMPLQELDEDRRIEIRTFAATLHELAQIRRDLGRPDCLPMFTESLDLLLRIGDQAAAAMCAFNIGHAYKNVEDLRDIEQAEFWYERSLSLRVENDNQGRSNSLFQLGNIAWERLREARKQGEPTAVVFKHLNDAKSLFEEALRLLPPSAIDDRAIVHQALGKIYGYAGRLDLALHHYRLSIHMFERCGDIHRLSIVRLNVAIDLYNGGRASDALSYAEAALQGFESYGERAAQDSEKTCQLIAEIRGAQVLPASS